MVDYHQRGDGYQSHHYFSGITIPQLYPAANVSNVIPNFVFDGTPTPMVGGTAMTSFAGTPYHNRDPIWNVIDNVTKVVGTHTFKAGLFWEYAVKTENAFQPYNGTINFGNNSSNPCDTNWAFANALTGCYQSYTQINADYLPNYPYTNFEFYGQDTWKVSKKLTLNYGLRVSYVTPFHDTLGLMSNFIPADYSPSQAVTFYQPVISGGVRSAINPITGAILPAVYIGAIVPGVGNINNGLVESGKDGTPLGLIKNRGAQFGPRLGVAYQIDNNTVFRMGGGVFYERVATFGIGITSDYTTNPPNSRTAQLYYGNLADIATSAGTFFPTNVNMMSPDGHVPTVYNYNAGIQRQLPQKLFLEVSYVGNISRHLWLAQPLNTVPFGSAWQSYTQDPTLTPAFNGTTNIPANMYRPYPGYGPITDFTWGTSANFNALQVSLNRRVGRLQIGANYMWSKALGVGVGHPTDTYAFGYGPLTQDRAQSLSVNYIYDLPSPGRPGSFLASPAAKLILDNWELAGLTSISTGAPVTPTYSVSGIGQTTLNQMITGSADVLPRVVLTCDPNAPQGGRNINAYINTSCFAPAQKGSIGIDSGYDPVFGPGINQWDMSLYKNIPVKERFRAQLRLEAYNAFNHTEWGTANTAAIFNTAGQLINLPTQLGGTGGRFGFGTENSIRANSQRILQVGAKLYF